MPRKYTKVEDLAEVIFARKAAGETNRGGEKGPRKGGAQIKKQNQKKKNLQVLTYRFW